MTRPMKKSWTEFAPLLMICGRGWRRALNAALTPHSLSDASAAPLIALLRHGDRIPQNLLAERVGVEGPTLVRVLDGLENDGLISRVPSELDRRLKLVQLTEEGTAVARRAESCAAELREQILGDLDPDKVDAALEVLRTIAAKTAIPAGMQDNEQ